MKPVRALFVALLVAAAAGCSERPVPASTIEAAIASAHPLATAAGHEILAQGGNAFDAAVAESAALGVVEPYSSGRGGGGFYLLQIAEGDAVFVDARERAPFASTRDMYLDDDGEPVFARMSEGALATGIPGTPAALVHVTERYGRLTLAQNLAPAVRLARDGFEVDARMATLTARHADKLRRHGTTAYFIDGEPPAEGEVLYQPELARTLESIAADGAESFYRGALADRLVAGVRAAGGIWTLEDLARYELVEREPLVGSYRGHTITTAPPPSSGGSVMLATLNILEGFDFAAMDEATRVHLLAESWRRTFRDRGQYQGDPAFVEIPVAELTGDAHAARLRDGIDLTRATPSADLEPVIASQEGTSTTHFSILDAEGNRVAATQTINFRFGSGLMPEDTGVVLNNEMFDFVPKAGSPDGFDLVSADANTVAPGKRPVSSMTPTIVDGPRGIAILGTPGGSRIITMVTLGVIGWIEGLPPESIPALPRFHHQYMPDRIQHEAGALTGETRELLVGMGHTLDETGRRYGNMNLVTWERESGAVTAVTDPRNESQMDF